MKTKLLTVILFALTTSTAFAAGTTETQVDVSNRLSRKFGAYLGILGDPQPSIIGFNVAYNVTDYLRASVGYGSVSVSTVTVSGSGFGAADTSLSTFGLGAKFLMPGWNLSPAVSLGYSFVSISEGVTLVDYKTSNLSLGLGADWQAASGFNAGAGMNLSLNGGAPLAPYLNVGYFF